ncbi:MAG TPA: VCBS repeat-containing protein [Chthonomonadaceae bacterium]|nr:VCBS repeat-containing protein [Chthonomonadaceae bacterium]
MKRWLVGLVLLLGWGLASPAAWASGTMGVDTGWVIDNSGNPLFTPAVAGQLRQAQVGWVRMEFRLVNGNTTWNAAMLGYYDTVVNTARANGLQVLGLIDYTSWPGSQSDWTANNYENTGANGDNSFIDNFAANAAVPIIAHFHDRVKIWEIWNEPNAWTSNPSQGVYTGGTFIYPSNFSQLLARTYADVKEINGLRDVQLISGGVFGHDIAGKNYEDAGAQYIDDTYNVGINTVGSFSYAMSHWGTYPLDGIGQHIYIDQGTTTTSGAIQQYCDWVRQAYTKYEGTGTSKHSFITEFGWSTSNVSQSVQDQNLTTAFHVLEGGTVNYVQTAIWFNWQDNVAAGLYFGVLDSGGNPKLCYNDFVSAQKYFGFRDGYPDLLFQNPSTGQLSLWFLLGGTPLSASFLTPSQDPAWRAVGDADVNQDGTPDILFQNRSTGQLALWQMSDVAASGGAFVTPVPPAGWNAVGLADFDGDGFPDVLLQNGSSGRLAVWYLRGATVVNGTYVSPAPAAGWTAVGVGDFNKDGHPDILFQNASTGQLAVWFMSNNLATDGTFVTPGQQAGWRCVSVVDLNGDGWPDLVFQNTNSGQLAYWLMNGVKAIDGNLFTVQPPPGWQVAGLH